MTRYKALDKWLDEQDGVLPSDPNIPLNFNDVRRALLPLDIFEDRDTLRKFYVGSSLAFLRNNYPDNATTPSGRVDFNLPFLAERRTRRDSPDGGHRALTLFFLESAKRYRQYEKDGKEVPAEFIKLINIVEEKFKTEESDAAAAQPTA